MTISPTAIPAGAGGVDRINTSMPEPARTTTTSQPSSPQRLVSEHALTTRRSSGTGTPSPRQSLSSLRPSSPTTSTRPPPLALPQKPSVPEPALVHDAITPGTPQTPLTPSRPSSPASTDYQVIISPGAAALAGSTHTSRERLRSDVGGTPRSSMDSGPADRRDPESLTLAHVPRQASEAAFFLMQNVRHAIPVAGVRTLVQGLAANELARAVVSNPPVAVAVQAALTAYSLGRRILSQAHSESAKEVANRSFAGHANGVDNSTPRRLWQGVQSLGIAGGDVAALTLTAMSMARPELKPVAQAMAAVQARGHLLSQLREFLRPAINTVHVGNGDPNVPQPPEGRNLRAQDISLGTHAGFGLAAGVAELASQVLSHVALGGQSAWNASRGPAAVAGLIAGVANMVTSSVEDHLIDNASARRMQQTDPSHVTHLHLESRNPMASKELGRQMERVDARVFNTMVPAMLALGVMQAFYPKTDPQQGGSPPPFAAQAAVSAISAGLVLGSLLSMTVKSYQMNDGVRGHRARHP